jgi:hypothetical protein
MEVVVASKVKRKLGCFIVTCVAVSGALDFSPGRVRQGQASVDSVHIGGIVKEVERGVAATRSYLTSYSIW